MVAPKPAPIEPPQIPPWRQSQHRRRTPARICQHPIQGRQQRQLHQHWHRQRGRLTRSGRDVSCLGWTPGERFVARTSGQYRPCEPRAFHHWQTETGQCMIWHRSGTIRICCPGATCLRLSQLFCKGWAKPNPGTISRSISVSITLFMTAYYHVFTCPSAHAVGGPKPEAWARHNHRRCSYGAFQFAIS